MAELGPLVGHHGVDEGTLVTGDGAQIELVQIDSAEREEQAPAADVTGSEMETMGEIHIPTEVEVIGELRALRVEHGAQPGAKVGGQTLRRADDLNDARREWVAERVWRHGAGGGSAGKVWIQATAE